MDPFECEEWRIVYRRRSMNRLLSFFCIIYQKRNILFFGFGCAMWRIGLLAGWGWNWLLVGRCDRALLPLFVLVWCSGWLEVGCVIHRCCHAGRLVLSILCSGWLGLVPWWVGVIMWCHWLYWCCIMNGQVHLID